MNICKHSDECGGCLYQGVEYPEQVKQKLAEVESYIERNHIRCPEFLGLEKSPSITAYRNKMEYTFGDMMKGGPTTLGMHKRKSFMSIINVDDCMLVDDDFNLIRQSVLEHCVEKGYSHYNKKNHRGILRNLIIRKGERTNELLVCIVTTSDLSFDEEAFKDMVLGLETKGEIVGVMRTINDNIADKVTNEELRVLAGRDYYNEEIMGLKFKVHVFAFFQTNISAVERLYREALDMIDDVSGKTVFDLYCGTGTITQTMALQAKKAVGVEISQDAVDSAIQNAQLNGLDNCEFLCGDVLKVLDDITDKPDVIVLDPPRAGIHHKVLPKLLRYGVDQILYISCNPKTMTPNLEFMQENGYRVVKMKAYDNFPFTKHIESVCLLSKK